MSIESARQKLETKLQNRATNEIMKNKPAFDHFLLLGPGSALKRIMIRDYGVTSCAGCHETAKEMDAAGPESVIQNIDHWAERVHENASKRKWVRVLDFIEYNVYGLKHYKQLIRQAVNEHIMETAKKKEWEIENTL